MNEFEIDLPNETAIAIDATDKSLYNYDFNSYSLASLQKTAALEVMDNIKKGLLSHVSEAGLIERLAKKGEVEYVASLSEVAKEKLNSGEWQLGIRKNTGETYAVIKDAVTGKNKSFVILEKKVVDNLGNLPELSAIQGQLASISEQIENMSHLVERIEQGQYNDRFSGFFSARQLVVEGMAAKDGLVRKNLLLAAVKTSNETIAKLMLSIHQDAFEFIDVKTNKKDARRIDNLLQNSIGYLNSAIQLNLVIYTALGEQDSLIAALANYQAFIEQTLLKDIDNSGRNVAWKLDNAHKGNDGKFVELSNNVSEKISRLIDSVHNDEIGAEEIEQIRKIENKNVHDAEL